MYAHPAQLDHAALRAAKLADVCKRLESGEAFAAAAGETLPMGGFTMGGGGGGRAIDRATLQLLHDVAKDQIAASAEGEARGSLRTYCTDAYAAALAKLAQALRHAADLLAKHGAGTYDAHVALRTIRTVEQAEKMQASRKVDWCLAGVRSSEQDKQLLAKTTQLQLKDGGSGGGGGRPPSRASGGSSPKHSPKKSTKAPTTAEEKAKMQFIYDSGSFDAAAAAAAEKSALEKREERRRKEKEVRELEEAAAMVAHKARGTKPEEAKDPNSPMKKKTAGELAKRRRELLQKHSMEGQTAKALQTESDESLLNAARAHQRALRSQNLKLAREWVILGGK